MLPRRAEQSVNDLTTPEDRFEKWFAEPLRVLFKYQHAGFVVMLTALSLLERLIRWRSGAGDVEGIEAHLPALSRIFPALAGQERTFWRAYRHGLAHRATFATKSRSGDSLPVVRFARTGEAVRVADREIVVDHVVFAQTVLAEIARVGVRDFMEQVGPRHAVAVVGPIIVAGVPTDSTSSVEPGSHVARLI
jgi:hypothetical protein